MAGTHGATDPRGDGTSEPAVFTIEHDEHSSGGSLIDTVRDAFGGGDDTADSGGDAPKRRGRPRGSGNAPKARKVVEGETLDDEPESPLAAKKRTVAGIRYVGKQLARIGGKHWEVDREEAEFLSVPIVNIEKQLPAVASASSLKVNLLLLGGMLALSGGMRVYMTMQLVKLQKQRMLLMSQQQNPPVNYQASDTSPVAPMTADDFADILGEQMNGAVPAL